jgi:hypothetical protein
MTSVKVSGLVAWNKLKARRMLHYLHVPFAKGVVTDVGTLSLSPAVRNFQFFNSTMLRWPDGSISAAFLLLTDDFKANEKRRYDVMMDSKGGIPSPTVEIAGTIVGTGDALSGELVVKGLPTGDVRVPVTAKMKSMTFAMDVQGTSTSTLAGGGVLAAAGGKAKR